MQGIFEVALHMTRAGTRRQLSEQVALAKIELGKRISELPKATTNHKRQNLENDTTVDFLTPESSVKPKSETIAELGLTQKQAERFQQMAQNPDAVMFYH